MSSLLIFGPGYTASIIGARLRERGWQVAAITRDRIDDAAVEIASVTHILSSVPPTDSTDPVLDRYFDRLAVAPARWIGYLSSTGVYGDAGGAWVDEAAPIGHGRRSARTAADARWLSLPQARAFRLPGIYGPGRSPLERVREGKAHRIDLPGQLFSRIHVDDIAAAVIASMERGPPGAYNIGDDMPTSQNSVIEYACDLLGIAPPPLQSLDDAALSPAARAFYSENRRVANGKAKRLLGWQPLYPDYRAGLRALSAITSPASVNNPPQAASTLQR
ncbi:NAD(P)-dependent oxidoreductase [Sphingomonas sp. DBB INV C78]|uniref:SDR family NAD(P)-dependent oxidoreductase n=1 Tax=Sphingomonas sp. DBB INV C78 TaxID=3349434 RepID=UPI0036D371BB